MKDHKILYGVTALVILIFTAWVWGWFDAGQYSADPKVAELERLRDANVTKGEPPREFREEMRTKMEGLSEQQRTAFFESSMPIFVPMMAKRFEEEYDKFVALSPEEQRKKLDERINEMEKRGGPGGPGGPGGNRPPMDPKKMNEIAKKMLDWTTPDQRTKFENGMRMMNERRAERGLQPLPPMGGF
jgi:hypothetical protein